MNGDFIGNISSLNKIFLSQPRRIGFGWSNGCFAWLLLGLALAWPLSLGQRQELSGEDRPNFVFFIVDDVSVEDLGCYGHPTIQTPNLDQLANNGLRFENAYLTISSCSPSRCSIISGRYPHNTGASELHTSLPSDQFMFPKALRDSGYYTVLSGKNHIGSATKSAFHKISSGKGPGREEDWVEILKDRPEGKPFFCWFASTDAHRGWTIGEQAPKYKPENVVVPDYLLDGPLTRKDLADYYHEVSRMDHFVGKVISELKRQDILNQTYVIFCADNGRPFPRCKTRLYDSGIKTPLIVSCPQKVQTGITNSLVSSIDFSATILELAGLQVDPRVQGVSFTEILSNANAKTREFVFAEHNWHVFQAHERMVRSGNLVLIRNNFPNRLNMCVEATDQFPSGRELWDAKRNGLPLTVAQADLFLEKRPGLELYDISEDPSQTKNLAQDPRFSKEMGELVKKLKYWTVETADTVPEDPTPDRQNVDGKKRPGFRRGEMAGDSANARQVNRKGPITHSGTGAGQ